MSTLIVDTAGGYLPEPEPYCGRWTDEEHELFLKGLRLYNRNWKKLAGLIKTRTTVQIRTHAQKYFGKLGKVFHEGGFREYGLKRPVDSSDYFHDDAAIKRPYHPCDLKSSNAIMNNSVNSQYSSNPYINAKSEYYSVQNCSNSSYTGDTSSISYECCKMPEPLLNKGASRPSESFLTPSFLSSPYTSESHDLLHTLQLPSTSTFVRLGIRVEMSLDDDSDESELSCGQSSTSFEVCDSNDIHNERADDKVYDTIIALPLCISTTLTPEDDEGHPIINKTHNDTINISSLPMIVNPAMSCVAKLAQGQNQSPVSVVTETVADNDEDTDSVYDLDFTNFDTLNEIATGRESVLGVEPEGDEFTKQSFDQLRMGSNKDNYFQSEPIKKNSATDSIIIHAIDASLLSFNDTIEMNNSDNINRKGNNEQIMFSEQESEMFSEEEREMIGDMVTLDMDEELIEDIFQDKDIHLNSI
eukprot:CAMPEP_0182417880 /NCGR_PEP_ID=MMETSP1167-20130531/2322_1 /TAXON_ID=2988 /ORGANISM="Mallomonas Sp, Strain CCMP3275" /LENGTH=470 /DNA_ID=CAMNT_0024591703 /DNA_START=32 /DNA_END=1444 /DNA_ORIENTATION=+